MFRSYPDIVSVTTMCEMLSIGKNYAYYLIKTDLIRCIRVGRKIRIPKAEIIKYVSNTISDTGLVLLEKTRNNK